MRTIYLNMKSVYGIETVDEFTQTKDQRRTEFLKYVNDMIENYRDSGMNVYKSNRSTKEWKLK